MNSRNYYELSNKNNIMKLYKELYQKKLKDRNKIRGFCFSYNNDDNPSFFKKYRKQNTFESKFEIAERIMKRNELKKVFQDYLELKRNITSYEKEHDHSKFQKDYKKHFSYNKINYTNLKEIFTDFIRDKSKHNFNKNSIIKSKLKIDNINRNIRMNRINAILEKVTLKSNKVKTKLDMGKNNNEKNEDTNINKLIGILNLSRKKLGAKRNTTRKKIISLDINKINGNENENYKNIINTDSNYNSENKTNILDNIIEKTPTNTYNEKQKDYNTDNISFFHSKDNNNNNLYIDNSVYKYINCKSEIKIKKRPLTHSRNPQNINLQYFTSSSNTNFNYKRSFRSAFKKSPLKIKNKPLYTTKIEDIMSEYYRIKKISKLNKIKHIDAHLVTYKEIDNLVKIREDLLLFLLQQKFNKAKFPKPCIKKSNKKKLFIQRLKENIDFIDKNQAKK